MSKQILIVDDEDNLRDHLARFFERRGYDVSTAADGESGIRVTRSMNVDVVLLDLRLPDLDGLEVLEIIKRESPGTGVVIITAYGDVDTAVRAIQQRADNFLLKPIQLRALEAIVEKILENYRSREEVTYLRGKLSELRGGDKVQHLLLDQEVARGIELLAENPSTNVLILGETGTGKGMVAHAIHELSGRHLHQLVELNCAGLSSSMLENELFGHEKGAFTDAKTFKRGLLEVAHKGSLFLDEIGEMSPEVQAKLLKVIEDRTFRRLGGTSNIRVDVRVMTATNIDLEEATRTGRFRRDLYYRLAVMPIALRPLKERADDIIPLANMFIRDFNKVFGRSVASCSREAETMLLSYGWPGNIRELRNVIERAMLLCKQDHIQPVHLPDNLRARVKAPPIRADESHSLADVESNHIKRVLALCGQNRSHAASLLGIHRATLIKKIKKYDLDH